MLKDVENKAEEIAPDASTTDDDRWRHNVLVEVKEEPAKAVCLAVVSSYAFGSVCLTNVLMKELNLPDEIKCQAISSAQEATEIEVSKYDFTPHQILHTTDTRCPEINFSACF